MRPQLARPLGAVPGPVTSPASAGCHRLLREYDAVCVVDADQVAELAGRDAAGRLGGGAPRTADPSMLPGFEYSSETLRVVDALSIRSARGIADLARRSGMSAAGVMAALGELEADGAAARRSEGWVRRRAR